MPTERTRRQTLVALGASVAGALIADGKHLDSPDHKSHVGGTAGFQLSSGMASSMHGDFMNAWEIEPLAERVRNCITQKAKCNSFGEF